MKRLVLALAIVLMMVSFAWADSYEAVTIDSTTGGVALTASRYGEAKWAMCRLETAEIRYTLDGTTAPTASVGAVLEPMEWLMLESAKRIRNFRGFATGSSSGNLKCFYFEQE